MNDETNVGFVDAHAEGDCCDDDIDGLEQESILIVRTCGAVESGMIRESLDVVDCE